MKAGRWIKQTPDFLEKRKQDSKQCVHIKNVEEKHPISNQYPVMEKNGSLDEMVMNGSRSTCPLFYARYHLRAPWNGNAKFSTYLWIIFKIKQPSTQSTLWVVYWGIFLYKMCLQLRFKMRVCIVFFNISPKTPFSIFTSQKSWLILREYTCNSLNNRGWIEKNNYGIYQNLQHFKPYNFEKFQQNLIISKSATIYHCSSTMAYGIVRARKLEKNTIFDSTTLLILFQQLWRPSYSYNKLNE